MYKLDIIINYSNNDIGRHPAWNNFFTNVITNDLYSVLSPINSRLVDNIHKAINDRLKEFNGYRPGSPMTGAYIEFETKDDAIRFLLTWS
jgi:hypothetical protein